MRTDNSLRRLGLVLTGVGVVNTLVMSQVLKIYDLYGQPIALYPQVILLLGFMLATAGLSTLLADTLMRATAPSTKLAKSLRWWALFLTGTGGGIAAAMIALIEIARIRDLGVALGPSVVLGPALLLFASGLICLGVDFVYFRRTRHRL